MDALNRCWLGFPLPPELCEQVGQAQGVIRRKAGSDAIRWKAPSEAAVLLVSLGEISPSTVMRLDDAVGPVAGRHEPIPLQIEGAGGSPNLTMPRTAWLGIAGEVDRLKLLHDDLMACTLHLSSTTDHTGFDPTVEIGRLRRFVESARTQMGRSLKMSKIGVLGLFTFDSVHVLCSEVTASGPSLRSLKSFHLGTKAI